MNWLLELVVIRCLRRFCHRERPLIAANWLSDNAPATPGTYWECEFCDVAWRRLPSQVHIPIGPLPSLDETEPPLFSASNLGGMLNLFASMPSRLSPCDINLSGNDIKMDSNKPLTPNSVQIKQNCRKIASLRPKSKILIITPRVINLNRLTDWTVALFLDLESERVSIGRDDCRVGTWLF